jgi:hypothetical protein
LNAEWETVKIGAEREADKFTLLEAIARERLMKKAGWKRV